MRALLRVRKEILGLTQAEMAAVANTTQATVSRWERGELEPTRDQLAMVLDFARGKDIALTPSDFFEERDEAAASTTARFEHTGAPK